MGQPKNEADEAVVTKSFGPDTVCWIASMTKLLTTVCALQCVEKGLLNLEDDVSEKILPEFRDIQVVHRFNEDENGDDVPHFRPSKGKITLKYDIYFYCETIVG